MSTTVCRRGVTLLEVIVATLLGVLVVNACLTTLARTRDAERRIAHRLDVLASFRLGRFVMRRELGNGVGGRDWTAATDTVALRAFRGTALVCPEAPPGGGLLVSYRGDRRPDPAKDSLLLLPALGQPVAAALLGVSSAPASCGGVAAEVELWSTDRPAPSGAVVARLYERGSYHLTDGALRYRRGAAGRQPLTPGVWSTPPSGWTRAGRSVGLSLVPAAGRGSSSRSGFVAWSGGGAP